MLVMLVLRYYVKILNQVCLVTYFYIFFGLRFKLFCYLNSSLFLIHSPLDTNHTALWSHLCTNVIVKEIQTQEDKDNNLQNQRAYASSRCCVLFGQNTKHPLN